MEKKNLIENIQQSNNQSKETYKKFITKPKTSLESSRKCKTKLLPSWKLKQSLKKICEL